MCVVPSKLAGCVLHLLAGWLHFHPAECMLCPLWLQGTPHFTPKCWEFDIRGPTPLDPPDIWQPRGGCVVVGERGVMLAVPPLSAGLTACRRFKLQSSSSASATVVLATLFLA